MQACRHAGGSCRRCMAATGARGTQKRHCQECRSGQWAKPGWVLGRSAASLDTRKSPMGIGGVVPVLDGVLHCKAGVGHVWHSTGSKRAQRPCDLQGPLSTHGLGQVWQRAPKSPGLSMKLSMAMTGFCSYCREISGPLSTKQRQLCRQMNSTCTQSIAGMGAVSRAHLGPGDGRDQRWQLAQSLQACPLGP